MDYTAAVDRHIPTLRRILAIMFTYMGLADFTPDAERLLAERGAGAARGFKALSDPWTISRRVHVMVRALLMPVEAATRRLIITLADDLPTPKLRPSEVKRRMAGWDAPKTFHLPRTSVPGVTVPGFVFVAAKPEPKLPVRMPRFSLFDPLKRFGRRRRPVRRSFPRIMSIENRPAPLPLKAPQTPYDRLPNRHLMRRVTALAHALDNMPDHARRFARWRAFREVDQLQRRDYTQKGHRYSRLYALRPGMPPGSPPLKCPPGRRREEHEVLMEAHWLATQARERRDSS